MPRAFQLLPLTLTAALLLATRSARADTFILAAGETRTLDADVVLTGGDLFDVGGDAGAPCVLHGAGFRVRSAGGWTGRFSLRHCQVDQLGSAGDYAIEIQTVADAPLTITDTTFHESGAIRLGLGLTTAAVFSRNTIAADSLVPTPVLTTDPGGPSVWITGLSSVPGLFQGNVILKSWAELGPVSHWTVGGHGRDDGNLVVGLRGGINVHDASDVTIEGNYLRSDALPCSSQVHNLSANGDGVDVRHNVVRGYNWTVSAQSRGAIAYNLLVDNIERGYGEVYGRAGARVHHNLLITTRDMQSQNRLGAFVVEGGNPALAVDSEIVNNTFDAGGTCAPGPAGAVLFKGQLASMRNNAFAGLRVPAGAGGLLHPYPATPGQPLSPSLSFADYNLYDVGASPEKTVFAVSVIGRSAGDVGYGAHDRAMGAPNGPAEAPLFVGPIPRVFAFDESAILRRETTVCQILAYYRRAYTPVAGGALIGGGDPDDGAPDMGAIGAAGSSDPQDLFGRASFCDPNDTGSPITDSAAFKCVEVPVRQNLPEICGGGGGGGDGGADAGHPGLQHHGISCVCNVTEGASGRGDVALAVALALAGLACARLRNRRAGCTLPRRRVPPWRRS